MDAFSEILSGVKLSGALFFSAEFSAPWGFSAPPSKQLAPLLAPRAAHLVIYHFVIDGRALVRLAGQSFELKSGDVVIFPHGDAHEISSVKGAVAPFPNYGITSKISARDLSPLHAGGGGEISRFVCGYMSCDPCLSRPILNGLPSAFKVNIRTDRSGQWLEKIRSCIWLKKPLRDESAAKRCWPNSRRPCSWTRCGATLPDCRNNRRDGWRALAIPLWGKASDCCMAAWPIRGRSPISRTRWAFRGRPSWSALRDIFLSHR